MILRPNPQIVVVVAMLLGFACPMVGRADTPGASHPATGGSKAGEEAGTRSLAVSNNRGTPGIAFQDVTAAANISFVGSVGPAFPALTHPVLVIMQSTMGNGAAVGDYDGDGDLDVYLLGYENQPNVLLRNDLEGPVNVVAPSPVTNETFTRTLGSVLGRPPILPLPSPFLRLALGVEMADALLLSSARVLPARLERAGYAFGAPDLRQALQQILGRGR